MNRRQNSWQLIWIHSNHTIIYYFGTQGTEKVYYRDTLKHKGILLVDVTHLRKITTRDCYLHIGILGVDKSSKLCEGLEANNCILRKMNRKSNKLVYEKFGTCCMSKQPSHMTT